jgi:hypothetical protein
VAGSRAAVRSFLFVVGSLLAHGALVSALQRVSTPAPRTEPARAHFDLFYDAAGRAVRPARAQVERERLVREAREQRARGELRLGAFLLAANGIDAAEENVPFDLPGAQRAFASRVTALQGALAGGSVTEAVARVFADLKYTGIPGGRMGDALLATAGSCEPTSQIVAAALHDAGLGDKAALRYYGGAIAGVTHLAAVVDENGTERDLTAGEPSRTGGTRFVAGDLIEVYARAHDLAPREAAPAREAAVESKPLFDVPATKTLAAGFPANQDKFDSPLPLFGTRAVAPPAELGENGGEDDGGRISDGGDATACVMHLPVALLDPPAALGTTRSGGAYRVDLVRQPTEADLERVASTIVHVESWRSRSGLDPVESLIVDACLAGLYDRAALELSLAGRADVAQRAMTEASSIRDRARPAVASALEQRGADAAKLRRSLLLSSHGRAWVLLFLDGTAPLLEGVADDVAGTFSEVLLVSGLVVSPETRAAALARAGRMPLRRRIDVMHEIFHAHDSSRPWASNYVLEAPDGASEEARAFVRGYEIFRPVAFRLWEAPAPPDEVVASMAESFAARSIDKETARGIAGYYVRNFVGLHRIRQSGREQVGLLDGALLRAGLPGVAEVEDLALTPSELEALGIAMTR